MNGTHWKSVPTVSEILVNSALTCWPPKNSDFWSANSGSFSTVVEGGNRNCFVARSTADCLFVLSHRASCAAWIGNLVLFSTASVEPPQLPEAGFAASHCGKSAARHKPAVFFAVPCRKI